MVNSAAFSRDGRRVVTASLDNTARIWQESGSLIDDPQALIARACGLINPEARKVGEDVCEGV